MAKNIFFFISLISGLIIGWVESLFLVFWPLPFFLLFFWWREEKEERVFLFAFLFGLWADLLSGGNLGERSIFFLLLVFFLSLFARGLKRKERLI